jgi:tRNA dimethylallyltransferase
MTSFANKPPVICLMGPTAAGKTALAMALCDALPCDIISVDSALIYRDMNIGTAKPSAEELLHYPHRLIDIRDASESYSVAEFCQDAHREIKTIQDQGRIPLLVGGTMMYFKGLIEGISPLPAADAEIRNQIAQQAQAFGWQYMHELLCQSDPQSGERIHPNDPQRITRALEVFRLTGNTLSHLIEAKGDKLEGNILQLAIAPNERKTLHDRIALRFEQMLAQGFKDEVLALINRGDLHENLPSIRCVGYRQMWEHLQGQYDQEEMLFRGICATRQLAKRQLTWLRKWPDLNWLSMENKDNLTLVLNKLKQF